MSRCVTRTRCGHGGTCSSRWPRTSCSPNGWPVRAGGPIVMTARFELHETPLAGLTMLQRRVLEDRRGFLQRLYCADELRPALGTRTIAQVNHTRTVMRGTVRGMHYQRPPHAET